MSYDIIKGIKIDEAKGTVTVKSACNNVSPRDFTWYESPSLSAILKKGGREAIDKVFLKEYWNGNFQRGDNLYDKTVRYNRGDLPYTWDNTGNEDDVGKEKYGKVIKYSYKELEDSLYKKYLNFKKRHKGNFVIHCNSGYLVKLTERFFRTTLNKKYAKTFKSLEDAVVYAGRSFSNDQAHKMIEVV